MTQTANQIRFRFVDFFKQKRHTFVPSSPVVPQDDPTLLFTNAGMNQFKAIFLGDTSRGLHRAVNSQKCMRVSGKHNDLEEVGRDHFHHTFFEMLGNWSFGDYYKSEAIAWAWELLTDVWGLPKDRLYATVYHDDPEAERLWHETTDIENGRVLRFDEKDNFWEMGETGPCGPCSEIHIDLGPGVCPEKGHTCGVNVEGCARYMELWNLVFIQYERDRSGALHELPARHIDTGMGLERVVRVLQGVQSNYDTDLFRPVIAEVERLSGRSYRGDDTGTPFRVIADHIRALVFAITDGAFPSNEGRGYVVRRLLRRAYRFGRELGFHEPFLCKLVGTLVEQMGEAYPEIGERRTVVEEVIRSEEERFGATLEQGIEKFEEMARTCTESGAHELPGKDVFVLYDTYGFPVDLTRLMAGERGLSIDEQGYTEHMEQQKAMGREAGQSHDSSGLTPDGWTVLADTAPAFLGYAHDETEASVVRYKLLGNRCLLVLDKTPFYAESGGQVGDRGVLLTRSGTRLEVLDTIKWNDLPLHRIEVPEDFDETELKSPVTARIESRLRAATRRNHSATHLLQAALRSVLGEHVRQSGSRVGPDELRFDFTHFKAMTESEIDEVEFLVNTWIFNDLPVGTSVEEPEEARKQGAMALFGEKYGDKVRVVKMGDVSMELCGGTHAKATGEIGLFHITAESSISAGIRRIEAVTGFNALELLKRNERTVSRVGAMLKAGEDQLESRIGALQDRVRELQSQLSARQAQSVQERVAELVREASGKDGDISFIVKDMGDLDKKNFSLLTGSLSDTIRDSNLDSHVFVVGARDGDKAMISACAGSTAAEQGIHCGELVKAAARKAGGGGGGSPTRAQAGAKDASRLQAALDEAREILSAKSGS